MATVTDGTHYILIKVNDRFLEAWMISGERAGSILLNPIIILSPSDMDLPFQIR